MAVNKSNLKLLQICLENLKDRLIFDEMSINNPLVYAIAVSNIGIFNAFIDYFGDFLVQFFSKATSFDHDFLFKLYNLDEDPHSFLFLRNYIDCRETKTGNTLLMTAILCNRLEIAISLAQCNGVDYGARNYDNQKALTLALDQIEKRNTSNPTACFSGNQKNLLIEENYTQLIHILVKTIDRNEIDRAFYCADDVVAPNLLLNKDFNINYIRFIP